MSNKARWIGAGLVTVVTLATAVAACSSQDPDWLGAAGIAVSSKGHPIAVIAVCSQHIDNVAVWNDGRFGTSSNDRSTTNFYSVKPMTGTVELDLARPGAAWRNPQRIDVTGSKEYVVMATREDKDAEVSQVSFDTTDVASLRPDTVYIDKNEDDSTLTPVSSIENFAAHICKN